MMAQSEATSIPMPNGSSRTRPRSSRLHKARVNDLERRGAYSTAIDDLIDLHGRDAS